MDKFILDRKYTTIIVFDKPISEKWTANISTEDMVSSHPLYLTMKYRFKMFVVKCLC